MEREMGELQLAKHQKEILRTRWQNETDYRLRYRRRRVDATASVKLKTIGHGLWFGNVVSCTPLTDVIPMCIRGRVSRGRKEQWGLFPMKEVLSLRDRVKLLEMSRARRHPLSCARRIRYVKARSGTFVLSATS